MRLPFILAFLLPLLPAFAATAEETPIAPRDAYQQPLPGLSESERELFFSGRALFRQSWVVAPASDRAAGLGPLYNRLACISCHQRNGRGRSPDGPDERMLSMLVRLSVPGRDAHGGPRAHPRYGGQLNEEGIPGVPGEGVARLSWQETAPVILRGGERVRLRRPLIQFAELAYGPMHKVLSSPRIGQPVYGLGLLQAVPEETLVRLAAARKPDGVRGRVNQVFDAATGKTVVGRFGLKANAPNLRQQIAGAFLGDLGITSSLFPEENCTPVEKACQQAPSGGKPELSDKDLDAIEYYLANIAPPRQRNQHDPKVSQGEAAFGKMGCALCHRPQLTTAEQQRFPLTGRQSIAPYSDLLLHDMGAGLSDHRPDYGANGREWRTPPLWGIGRVAEINEHSQFLHDGRARNLQEAILWHGGEGRTARERYVNAPRELRQAVLAFLDSL